MARYSDKLVATRAEFEKLISAAGADVWPERDIKLHMAQELAPLRANAWYWVDRGLGWVTGRRLFFEKAVILAWFCVRHRWDIRPTIVQPGIWLTHPIHFTPEPRSHVLYNELTALMRDAQALVPGTTFEVSELYQGKHKCDPVLWLISPDGKHRVAGYVWKGARRIRPPAH
jgi:hypothetical protein